MTSREEGTPDIPSTEERELHLHQVMEEYFRSIDLEAVLAQLPEDDLSADSDTEADSLRDDL